MAPVDVGYRIPLEPAEVAHTLYTLTLYSESCTYDCSQQWLSALPSQSHSPEYCASSTFVPRVTADDCRYDDSNNTL